MAGWWNPKNTSTKWKDRNEDFIIFKDQNQNFIQYDVTVVESYFWFQHMTRSFIWVSNRKRACAKKRFKVRFVLRLIWISRWRTMTTFWGRRWSTPSRCQITSNISEESDSQTAGWRVHWKAVGDLRDNQKWRGTCTGDLFAISVILRLNSRI